MNPIIVAALAAVVVIMVVLVLFNLPRRKEQMSARVKRMVPNMPLDDMDPSGNIPSRALSMDEENSELAKTLGGLLSTFGINIKKQEKQLSLKFTQAGIHSPDATIYYLAARYIGIPLGLLLAFYLFMIPATGPMRMLNVVVAIVAIIVGAFGSNLYIQNRKQKRQHVLTRSFPDALDLLLVCVESGLALDAALARVCSELGRAHPEITKEFNRTRMELTLLNDRGRALQNLAERTDLVAFRSLVASLLQTERFGTSLTDTLRVLSEDYRNTRLMIAENKAGRLPALMTIPLICLIMPAFIMLIMGPAIIQLMDIWGK